MTQEHIGILIAAAGFMIAGGLMFVRAYFRTHPVQEELPPEPEEEEIVQL